MSGYIEIIRTSFIYFPVVAAFLVVPYILYNYHRYGSFLSLKVAIFYSFILYMMTVYFLVILPLPSVEAVRQMTSAKMQLQPFSFIQDILKDMHHYNEAFYMTTSFFQFVANVMMVVPFGMYLRYYFELDFKKTCLLSFLLTVFFELTQLSGLYGIYPRPYRLFDVDDLIANTLGGVMGYFFAYPLTKLLPSRHALDNHSRQMGLRVSWFRRVVACCVDVAIMIIVNGALAICFDAYRDGSMRSVLYSFIAYFLLCPIVFNGRTLGCMVVKLQLVSSKLKTNRLQFAFRYILEFIEVVIYPCALICGAYEITMGYDNYYRLIGFLVAGGLYGLTMLVEILLMIFNQPVLFERLSCTRFISRIEIRE